MKLISEQNDGVTVKLILGEQIAIQLPENPTTGYSWDSSDWCFPDNIDLIQNKFVASTPVRVGSGGYRRWIIKPTQPGNYRAVLGYQRNWEDNPITTFTFSLVVVEPEPPPKETKEEKAAAKAKAKAEKEQRK